jgi:hypothetical protein
MKDAVFPARYLRHERPLAGTMIGAGGLKQFNNVCQRFEDAEIISKAKCEAFHRPDDGLDGFIYLFNILRGIMCTMRAT